MFAGVLLLLVSFSVSVSAALTERLTTTDREDLPAIGVAVIEPHRAHFAVTGERETGTQLAVTDDDLWHLGSNTKAMTALLTLRLQEEGVVSLDAPLEEMAPSLMKSAKPPYRQETVETLLSHRSGVQANLGPLGMLQLAGSDATRNAQDDRKRLAGWMLSRAPVSDGFVYSNVGYSIAGAVLEERAGTPYETLMLTRFAEPLQLGSFGFGPPGSDEAVNQPRGHRGGKSAGAGWAADNPPAYSPAGRAHLSLADISRYLALVLRGTSGADEYVPAQAWQRLITPPQDGQAYALGWAVRPNGELEHAGSNTMWFAHFIVDRQNARAYAFVTNSGDLEMAQRVESALMPQLRDYSFDASPQ